LSGLLHTNYYCGVLPRPKCRMDLCRMDRSQHVPRFIHHCADPHFATGSFLEHQEAQSWSSRQFDCLGYHCTCLAEADPEVDLSDSMERTPFHSSLIAQLLPAILYFNRLIGASPAMKPKMSKSPSASVLPRPPPHSL
jgi:hypothetical protein